MASGLGAFTWDPLLGHTSRTVAMSLPTIARSRDVLCGAISQVPLVALIWDRTTGATTPHPDPPLWLDRPDPNRTRGALMADVVDDLVFHRVAYLWVRSRGAAGFPSTFQHLPATELTQAAQASGQATNRSGYRWNDIDIPARDVIVIESPQSAALAHGWRSIEQAVKLEEAANRFATTEVPAGWLKQTGGVALTLDEQTAMARQFAEARQTNTVAMLNEHVSWNESSYDPSRLQLTEARAHGATDQARIMNVPAAIVHAPTNDSLTYANAQDQRKDLWAFGLAPHAHAIASTLSGPNVTPRGTVIRFDPTDLIADPFDTDTEEAAPGGPDPDDI